MKILHISIEPSHESKYGFNIASQVEDQFEVMDKIKSALLSEERKTMEIVEYSNNPKNQFRNIPKQDNPAYGDTQCLMIIPDELSTLPYKNCGSWIVLHIIPVEFPEEQEAVHHIGRFWEVENARLFAKSFVEKQAQ